VLLEEGILIFFNGRLMINPSGQAVQELHILLSPVAAPEEGMVQLLTVS
jgi:hypothetical protein